MLVLVLLACDPAEPGLPSTVLEPLFASGSRLRAVVYEAPGGVRVAEGLYDTELSVPCAIRPTGPDEWHCVPLDAMLEASPCGEPVFEGPTDELVPMAPHVAAAGAAFVRVFVGEDGSRFAVGVSTEDGMPCEPAATDGGSRCLPTTSAWRVDGWFADADCTEPVAVGVGECDVGLALDAVGSRIGLRPLEDPADGLFAKGDGTCAEEPRPSGTTPYRLGERIASDTWPPASEVRRGTGPLTQTWRSDGSGVPMVPTPELWIGSSPCRVARLGERVVCAPDVVDTPGGVGRFADDACTVPLLRGPDAYRVEWSDDRTEVLAVWAAGPRHAGATFERSPFDSECRATSAAAYDLVSFDPPTLVPVDG